MSGDLLEVTGQCNGEYDMGLAGPLTVRGGRGADSAELSGYVGLDAVRLSQPPGLSPGSRGLRTAVRCASEHDERAGQERCGAKYLRLT